MAATTWFTTPPASLKLNATKTRAMFIRCNVKKPFSPTFTKNEEEPQALYSWVKAFSPATMANLGSGFDFLGCAVDGIRDTVSLRVDPNIPLGKFCISNISGQNVNVVKLSKNPSENCAGIAGIGAMKMLGIQSVGLSLSLAKGLPLGSGLGSSVASAAAAAVAVNKIFGKRLGLL